LRIPTTIYPSHIRLSNQDLQKLFGPNYKLTNQKNLPQENTFICKEKLTIQNLNYPINNIPIIGPTIKETQVLLTKKYSESHWLCGEKIEFGVP
jgi:propanediol utilization protein